MKIDEILDQSRRDFTAIYVCENCKHTVRANGYDDSYFHNDVIPNMKCPKCGKSSRDLGVDYRPLTTKYAEGFQV